LRSLHADPAWIERVTAAGFPAVPAGAN
jgi:hypothetical protein